MGGGCCLHFVGGCYCRFWFPFLDCVECLTSVVLAWIHFILFISVILVVYDDLGRWFDVVLCQGTVWSASYLISSFFLVTCC